ncbi:YadA-like family protein [Rouxiella sp. Mn2063]|uniref:YadA-like family protein n=1 Tax=Rouxiella sp. Mn2063 TaxID=3395262 RepID=UPI003BC86FA1
MNTLADALTALNSGVDTNKENISTNRTNIAANTADIATSNANIVANTSDIATNRTNIAINRTDIEKTIGSVERVVSTLGGGASVDANGSVTAPRYNVQGQQTRTVGDALAALNSGVDSNKATIDKHTADIASNKTSITNITNDLNAGTVGLVMQDATTHALSVAANSGGTLMSLAGTDGARTLTGVNAGVLSVDSSEAVNGSQLFATNRAVDANTTSISENRANIATHAAEIATSKENIATNTADIATSNANIVANTADIATNRANIATNRTDIEKTIGSVERVVSSLGGGASVDANGSVTAPRYNVQGQQTRTVGDALTALNSGVDSNKATIDKHTADIASNKTSITNITNDLNAGTVGLVMQDATTHALSVAANSGGTLMSLAGTDGARTLTGVNAGVLSVDSSEAVNGSQLFATNRAVDANTTSISENRANIATHAAEIATSKENIATNTADIATSNANIVVNTSDIATNRANIATNRTDIEKTIGSVERVVSTLGGGASVDANGSVTAPRYNVQGQQTRTVGDALAALNSGVDSNKATIDKHTADIASNKTSITNITNDLNAGTVGLVTQDATTHALSVAANSGGTLMSLAGTDGARTLTGVNAGVLSVDSREAVNGSQLFATNAAVESNTTGIASNAAEIKQTSKNISSVVASLGAGASVDANGDFIAPNYSVQSQKANTVGSALAILNDGVDTNKVSIANISKEINSGNVGLVKQDANTFALSVAATTGGTSMSIAGSEGSRILSGVKAGLKNEDAINVSQLKNLFDELGASDASIDETNGKIRGPRYSIQGISYNLGDSLAALDARVGTINANMGNSIHYDNDARNKVTLGGSTTGSPVTITNIANGNIAAGSTDAVNGGQLYQVKNQVDKNTDDINEIKNNVDGIANGSVGLIQQDRTTQQITVGKDKGGNSVSLTGTSGDRILSGVANGVADNDAATVSQVKDIAKASSNVSTNNSSNRVKAAATGRNSAALGSGAQASADNSVALGSNAQATGKNSIALGNDSIAERDNTVSVGTMGAERQMTNVARGSAGTDAVNVDQLNEGLSSLTNTTNQNFRELGKRMTDMKDKLSGGVASAMAMGSLPQPYRAGAGMMSMGGGTYNGQSAVAIGASKVSENGKWVTKVQGSSNTQGDFGMSVGVGYQW